MYKVFINNKAVSFYGKCKLIPVTETSLVINFISEELMFAEFRDFINKPGLDEMFINCNMHVNKIFRLFTSHFILLKAAGGIVKNPDGDMLFIYRYDKWDLPKGKVEKKEKTAETALREVEEETGIKLLKITGKLPPVYHIYNLNDREILKKTSWYEMETTDRAQPVPQTTENISLVRWLKPAELEEVLNNTYDSLKRMIERMKTN